MKNQHDERASRGRLEDYSKIWFRKALELINRKNLVFDSVIDIGAGKGEFLELVKNYYKPSKIYAIDYTKTNIKRLTEKNIKAIKADLDNIDINDYSHLKNSLDLIICLETIEHVFDTNKLFQFFNYLLKENGVILLSTPNMKEFQFRLFYLLKGYPYGEGHHIRFFTGTRLQQYAFFNGFDIVCWNNFLIREKNIIRRGFGIRNDKVINFLNLIIQGPLAVFSKLKILKFFANNGLMVLLRKSTLGPLGLELESFRKRFNALSDNEKKDWIKRIKRYYKKDRLKEHIHFKEFIENNLFH